SRFPLDIASVRKRVVAGTSADILLYATSRASARLHVFLSPVDSWVAITPQRFTLDRDRIKLDVTISASLAGLPYPQLEASVVDARGFIQTNQMVEALELDVIPRATYAEWLAERYLERTGTEGALISTRTSETTTTLRRGSEYFGSRGYQPGDPLRDIDWKHTAKLGKLIVKEQYVEGGGQAAILGANLSVTSAEEADRVAFDMITAALTLAREAIPTALAIYNHQKVVLTTPILDP
ncbi:unnamed protein product, partial [marine sediment metagenome]